MECVIDGKSLACAVCGRKARVASLRRECAVVGYHPSAPPCHGPGTELSKLLKRLRIEPTPTCQCRAKAQQMDAWGPDECERPERIDEVVAVMREEAKARGLPFIDAVGRMLVRRAIKLARKNSLDKP